MKVSVIRRVLILAIVLGVTMTGIALAGDGPKNLQVLPKSMDKKAVKKVMKGWTKALGVQCDFCHDMSDFSKDTNPHKKMARKMVKMTMDLNKKSFGGKMRVTCATCHNGKAEPK